MELTDKNNGLAEYGTFIKEIKDLIYRRQYEAMKQVNKELIQLYWEIGEEINSQQNEKGWGKSIVEILSKELQKEFPGVQGFSAANLWRMRNFYLNYNTFSNLAPLVREISWTILSAIIRLYLTSPAKMLAAIPFLLSVSPSRRNIANRAWRLLY